MDSITLIIFSLIVVFLCISIIALSFYYSNLVTKLVHAQKENLYLRFHIQEKGLAKINDAKDRSMKIIADASLQAQDLIKHAEVLKNDSNENTKQELQSLTGQQKDLLLKASNDLRAEFEEVLKHLQVDDIDILKSITKDIENIALEEVKTFEGQLKQQTIGQQEIVDQKIEEALDNSKNEIETYKKKKMAEIDQQIYTVLQNVTKDIIGKRLTFEDHKELIMQAIVKAKIEMINI
jgi:hypothetical protein